MCGGQESVVGLKSTLFLLLLTGLLCAWALNLKGQKADAEQKNSSYSPVAAWSETELMSINSIRLVRKKDKDKDLCFIKLINGQWFLSEPRMALADQLQINQWLRVFLFPDPERVLKKDSFYEKALQENGTHIEIATDHRKFSAVLFSMPNHEHHFFIAFDDRAGEILKIKEMQNASVQDFAKGQTKPEGQQRPFLNLPLEYYLSKLIFPNAVDWLSQIDYTRDGVKGSFVRKDERTFSSSLPLSELFYEWLLTLSQATFKNYVEAVDPKSLGEPVASCLFSFKEQGAKAKLLLYKLSDGRMIAGYESYEGWMLLDSETQRLVFPKVESLYISKSKP